MSSDYTPFLMNCKIWLESRRIDSENGNFWSVVAWHDLLRSRCVREELGRADPRGLQDSAEILRDPQLPRGPQRAAATR